MELNATHLYYIFCGFGTLIPVLFYLRRKHRIRSFFLGSSSGLAVLFLSHYFGECIGFAPELSRTNLLVSGILGIPGVLLLYLSGILFAV